MQPQQPLPYSTTNLMPLARRELLRPSVLRPRTAHPPGLHEDLRSRQRTILSDVFDGPRGQAFQKGFITPTLEPAVSARWIPRKNTDYATQASWSWEAAAGTAGPPGPYKTATARVAPYLMRRIPGSTCRIYLTRRLPSWLRSDFFLRAAG